MNKACSVDNCNKAAIKKGFCNPHYMKWWKHGDPCFVPEYKKHKQEHCIVDGCDGKVRSGSWYYCEKHYMRTRRNGTIEAKVEKKHYSNCKYCGRKTKNGRKYCDSRCFTRSKRSCPVFRVCGVCGEKFKPKNKGADYHTCSGPCREEYKKRLNSEYRKGMAKYKVWAGRIGYADKKEEGKDGCLLCYCTYCGKPFIPTNMAVGCRVSALEGKMKGELRLYCSEKCKKACPTYRAQTQYQKKQIGSSREVPAEFRFMALLDRGWICEKCGSTEDGLHVHHVEGYTEQPMLSADLCNVLVVCKKCHKEIHSQDGCRYVDYRCNQTKSHASLRTAEDVCLKSATITKRYGGGTSYLCQP